MNTPKLEVGMIATIKQNTTIHRFSIGQDVKLVGVGLNGGFTCESADAKIKWYVNAKDLENGRWPTQIPSTMKPITEHQFHAVWTAAVGRPGYNKKFFQDLLGDMIDKGQVTPTEHKKNFLARLKDRISK